VGEPQIAWQRLRLAMKIIGIAVPMYSSKRAIKITSGNSALGDPDVSRCDNKHLIILVYFMFCSAVESAAAAFHFL
jgi:activator of HSP90 ATPase